MTVRADEAARAYMRSRLSFDDMEWDGVTPVHEMRVERVTAKFARPYIASFHYSHTMPDSTRFAFAGYIGNRLCGVICYGMGCGKNQYTALIPDIENGEYIELTRLWCADSFPRNTESKLISESLRMLPPEIKLVVSFADEAQGHAGTIYQATNWLYCGRNGGGRQLLTESGVRKHPRLLGIYRMRHPEYRDVSNGDLMELLGYQWVDGGRKHRYVMLRGSKNERRRLLKSVADKIQPYPKMGEKQDKLTDAQMIDNVED